MDNLIGLTIGNFEILKLLGRGGMSSVYLASDKELERHVALKIPHERFQDRPSFVKRFRREAMAMARLRHPNIVQIYSVGSHGELPFFAMEHVRGKSLDGLIREKGPLSARLALDYIAQVARAIEYAHKKGIVHRDIKPANILVESSRRLLVTDFGVSKMLSAEETKETIGFIGTPQYMSPEQCGQGTLDHRTDIYSMGAVLFEMLTGQAAFSSDSPAEVIKKQLFDMPEFPLEFRDKIPDKLQALITKMLAKDPEQRYPDVRSLLRAIEDIDCEGDDPREDSSTAQTVNLKDLKKSALRRPRNKRKRALAYACLLVVCGAAFLVAFRWQTQTAEGFDIVKSLLFRRAQAEATVVESNPAPPVTIEEPVAQPQRTESTSEMVPEPEAVSVAELAEMVLTTEPRGAEVFVDSEPRGLTPLTLEEMAPGKHLLAMRLEGHPPYGEEISVDTRAPVEVFHDFAAAKEALIPKGSLRIDSDPPGAEVFINGENRGETPLDMPDMLAADYVVKLEREGYRPVRKQITLLPDENLRISLSLAQKPKHGSVRISSSPAGAEVLINGAYKGSTPLILDKLPVGEYDVAIGKNGYKAFRQVFVCTENSEGTIDAALDMTPRFAAMESMIAGDRHAQMGELALAAEAYSRALSLDPEAPAGREKFKSIRRALARKEIKGLLSSYEIAYDSENAELLASLLDASSPGLLSEQVANAESLFREFDNIDMSLSNPRVTHLGPGKVVVEFRLGLSADFAETGASTQLLSVDQVMTFQRSPEAGWKICAIE